VALRDISFQVNAVSAVRIIGHNGAGKSTLLRVAGGILDPSDGTAMVRGSLAPVIELGIGFEAELSGRENIYFNGALLGRSRVEMERRTDEIVDFAGLDEFIDQPLRTYSTGMVARLAFAVATTVDAQILLLDEIMSVGDESFKFRCQERIESFRQRGVTILVVSHDLEAIVRLCDDALWLEHGVLLASGPAEQVVARYRASVDSGAHTEHIGGTRQMTSV